MTVKQWAGRNGLRDVGRRATGRTVSLRRLSLMGSIFRWEAVHSQAIAAGEKLRSCDPEYGWSLGNKDSAGGVCTTMLGTIRQVTQVSDVPGGSDAHVLNTA